jgi:hypothetical protein
MCVGGSSSALPNRIRAFAGRPKSPACAHALRCRAGGAAVRRAFPALGGCEVGQMISAIFSCPPARLMFGQENVSVLLAAKPCAVLLRHLAGFGDNSLPAPRVVLHVHVPAPCLAVLVVLGWAEHQMFDFFRGADKCVCHVRSFPRALRSFLVRIERASSSAMMSELRTRISPTRSNPGGRSSRAAFVFFAARSWRSAPFRRSFFRPGKLAGFIAATIAARGSAARRWCRRPPP